MDGHLHMACNWASIGRVDMIPDAQIQLTAITSSDDALGQVDAWPTADEMIISCMSINLSSSAEPIKDKCQQSLDESETSADALHGKPVAGSLSGSHMPAMATPRRSSGLMGRFGQWLSLDTEEPRSQPTEQKLAAHQRTLQTIQQRHIDSIFTESKFLQADSLLQLARAIVWAAGRPQKGSSSLENEDTAVFAWSCLL